jgi:hypothetical protein
MISRIKGISTQIVAPKAVILDKISKTQNLVAPKAAIFDKSNRTLIIGSVTIYRLSICDNKTMNNLGWI